LVEWSADYMRCPRCETLVRRERSAPDIARVVDDDSAFYGREYWFSHQEGELGCPTILQRTRADLPERCLHWLRTALRYKLPPARALELGSGPGGFVALLTWAGFDASGLELSPWVVEFVRDTFQVPMLLGPVEDQAIEPGSLDLIAAMDVLEHLPDPVGTMRHCLRLLKPDGVLLIQTPRYPEGGTHETMVADGDRFLDMLRPRDHLHLFSQRSIRQLFSCVGAEHIAFEPAMFAEYDMFAVVSRMRPTVRDAAEIDTALSGKATGRMVQALMDLDAQHSALGLRHAEAEADRAARLDALEAQGHQLGEAEAERKALRGEVDLLREHLDESERDRAERLRVIENLGRRLGETEAERNESRAETLAIRGHLEVAEADRAARLNVIHEQAQRLHQQEQRLHQQEQRLHQQEQRLADMELERAETEAILRSIRSTRIYKLLRLLGRWKFDGPPRPRERAAIDSPAPAVCPPEAAASSTDEPARGGSPSQRTRAGHASQAAQDAASDPLGNANRS
jgi:SAM-dependent methyltransferase